MPTKILSGPVLGLESDSDYTVCFLTDKSVLQATLATNGKQIKITQAGRTANGIFWRAKIPVPTKSDDQSFSYAVKIDGESAVDQHGRSEWRFHVPGKTANPRIGYASCNGFSSSDLHQKTATPYFLWEKMVEMHAKAPFSLLILGGDQLYADSVWEDVPSCREWKELSYSKKIKKSATKKLKDELERFYEKLYISRWKNSDMSLIFASVPSLMMWDDHDIFDGWGSYPEEIQNCEVYQAIFSVAKRYFEMFQIRTIENTALFSQDRDYYSFGVEFRQYYILGMDNRSQRTLSKVMDSDSTHSTSHWDKVIEKLESINSKILLIMSGIPVVYRDFSAAESIVDSTPWQEELTDDLKDQWRAKQHQGERLRLIMHLLDSHAKRAKDNDETKSVILSGDIHIACLGAILDRRNPGKINKIHQVVSSAIVHPPPSWFQWQGMKTASNDHNEFLNPERSIETVIVTAVSAEKYMRTRNFSYLEEGSDGKLWVNWICETEHDAEYPLD